MRKLLVPAVCVLATMVSAQTFEGWVMLPDSFLGVAQVDCMVHDSATNTVWITGRYSDRVLGVQCDSNRRVSLVRIPYGHVAPQMVGNPTNATVFGHMWDTDRVWVIDSRSRALLTMLYIQAPRGMFHNPINNRVYCSSAGRWLVVIDGHTNRVVDSIDVGYACYHFGLDTRRNWLYLSFSAERQVSVVDCEVDSVIEEFDTQRLWPADLCYSPRSDLMYCAHYIDDLVLALRRDTVFAEIPVGAFPTALCYNPHNNKVYCANYSGGTVNGIDCSTNRVTAIVRTEGNPEILVYDSLHNRLYCTTGREVVAIEGDSDRIVTRIPDVDTRDALVLSRENQTLYYPARSYRPHVRVADALTGDSVALIPTLGNETPVAVCWNLPTNKVYAACCSTAGAVYVIDGARNDVLGRIPVGRYPVAVCSDPDQARVYCADSGSRSLSVIDCATDSVMAQVMVGMGPRRLLYVAPHSKVYSANASNNSVTAVDTRNLTTTTISSGSRPWDLAYSPQSGKVYSANYGSSNVTIISARNDSVIRTIGVGPSPRYFSYASRQNSVYCSCDEWVYAIDCSTDNLIASIAISDVGGIGYDSDRNWLYCSRNRIPHGGREPRLGIAIVDCSTNQVISEFDVPGSPYYGWGAWIEFAFNPINGKMYGIDGPESRTGGELYIYYGTDLVASYLASGIGSGFAWNSRNNRMYTACAGSRVAVVRDAGGGVVEDAVLPRVRRGAASLIARGVLRLQAGQSGALLDISGRRVTDLKPGENDISRLSPGVYFVHAKAEGGRLKAEPDARTRKVIIQH